MTLMIREALEEHSQVNIEIKIVENGVIVIVTWSRGHSLTQIYSDLKTAWDAINSEFNNP